MKSLVLAAAALAALTGAAFAADGGERPEPQDNAPAYRGYRPVPQPRYEPPRYPRIYVEPTERLRNPRPVYRSAFGYTCETSRFSCELSRPQRLGDDCSCRSPSGNRRAGTVVP